MSFDFSLPLEEAGRSLLGPLALNCSASEMHRMSIAKRAGRRARAHV